MGTQNNLPEQIRNIIENDPLFFSTTSGPMSIQHALDASGDQVKLSAIDDVLKSQQNFLKDYIKEHVHTPIKRVNKKLAETMLGLQSARTPADVLDRVSDLILDRYNITPASFKNPDRPDWSELTDFPEPLTDLAANFSAHELQGIKDHISSGDTEKALAGLFEKDVIAQHIRSRGTLKHIDFLAKIRKTTSPSSGFNKTFKKLRKYEEELSAETKVFSSRQFKAIITKEISGTPRRPARQIPRGIKTHIEPGERPHRVGSSQTEDILNTLLEESMPTRIDMYGQTDITISAQRITSLRQLEEKGFSTRGLAPILDKLQKSEQYGGYGASLYLRGSELVTTGLPYGVGRSGEHVAIPLFSKSISPSGPVAAASDASEYMFKGGSTYGVVKDISVLGESGRLEEPRRFSEVVYSEISNVLKRGTSNLREDINRTLGTMDPLMDSSLDILEATKDSPGMVDPVRYAGGIKIGRSRRSTAHQRMIQVNRGTQLHDLLMQEQEARLNFFKGTSASGGKAADIKIVRDRMEEKQQGILDHIRTLKAEDPTSQFGKSLGHMNLAWTPQSAESIFRPPTESEQRGIFYLKLNTRPIEDMSILAGQVPWEKGQQFGAGISPVEIRSAGQLPTSVSRMDSYKGETLAEIRQDVFDLSNRGKSIQDTNVVMGRKVIGLQFYNDELNKALFADSGVAMSGSLIQDLDIDPVTGRTRHTVSHSVPLMSLMENETGDFGQLKFRGMLRADLHQAILGEEDQLLRGDRTITFKPGEEIPVFLGESRIHRGRKVKKIRHTEPALPGMFHKDVKGQIVIGERVLDAADITKEDLAHAHDIENTLRSRGMDPTKSVITGVRISGRSGELQLIMAEKDAPTKVDLGYAIDHKRISVGQVLSQKAEDQLKRIVGISTDIDTPIVFGDLGLGIIKGKKRGTTPSFGFNKTLLTNLADIISKQAGGDRNHIAAKALVSAMGGEISVANIGGKKVLQFVNLGNIFTDRVSDKEFLGQFQKALTKTGVSKRKIFDETFAEVSLKDVLTILPGYKSKSKQQQEKIKETLRIGKTATYETFKKLGLIDGTGVRGDKHIIMKQMAAQIGVRGEEPARTFGTASVKVKLRDVAMLGESIEFATGRKVGTTKIDLRESMKAKQDLFMSFIDSNAALLKKDDELSLIYQQYRPDPDSPDSILPGYFEQTVGGYLKQAKAVEARSLGHISRLTRAAGTPGLEVDTYRQSTKSLKWLKEQVGKRGRASIEDLGETILGMVDPGTGVVKISDQAYLVKGRHGPMVVPSAKTLQFAKETGFVRMPGASNKDFLELYDEGVANLTSGRVAGKQAQAMYLDILQDVEDLQLMEEARKVDHIGGLEDKLNHLYRIMAGNNLSKEGLYYTSTVDAKGLKFASELRLQIHGKVGKFEVGLTEDALRNMSFGNKYSDIDSIIDQAKKGELYTTVVREPAAGGRQQFALKVKLLENTDFASKEVAKDFSFNGTAFLNSMMIEYGMEGDTDKDLVKLFRLNSMSDRTMRGIHGGQKDMMEKILNNLMDDPSNVVADALRTPGGQTPRTFGDIARHISNLEDMTTSGTIRQHTFDSLIQIAGPKHATPLIESYYRGRSYLDYMVGQILDVQADGAGKNILRQNLLSRLSEDGANELGTFLDQANMIMGQVDSGKGRSATYHYTDARNLIKYMHLKKTAGGVVTTPATAIYDMMSKAQGLASQSNTVFIDELFRETSNTTGRARELIDGVAEQLLIAADIKDAATGEAKLLRESRPETLNLLQNYAGNSDRAMREARTLAHRMLFVETLQTKLKIGTSGTALGGPFESIMRQMGVVMEGLNEQGILRTEAPAALAMADIQGLAGIENVDEIIQSTNREVMDSLARDTRERKRMGMQDAGSEALVTSGSTSTTGKSGYRNAMISGEFFAKISRTKYFAPAAAIVGGLAGIEAAKSALNRFNPGNVPASLGSAGVMPPPPIMSSPQDPSFHVDGIPNTSIARVARSEGQRSTLHISGKMGGHADFKAMTNQHLLSNGYMPTIQGSFTSNLNDTMSRTEISGHMEDRMNSVF